MNELDDIKGDDGGLRELALFAGAGGGILGGHLLGWRTVCAVERDAYAAAVLCQRQNDGLLPPFPVWADVSTFNGYLWQGIVEVISGGFPCQDISAAGKGAGITGSRSWLWKEFARIIGEVRPQFVYVENSPILTSRGARRCSRGPGRARVRCGVGRAIGGRCWRPAQAGSGVDCGSERRPLR